MSFSVDLDRVGNIVHSLSVRSQWRDEARSKLKDDAIELIQDMAREIVQLRIERDDLLAVTPPDPAEIVDVVTEADAVAFITEATNNWGKH